MINSAYVKNRSKNNLKRVLLNIKNKTGEQVKICTTDGLTAYENIVKKNWGYDNKVGKYKVEHRVITQSKGEGFNIWVERMHNSIRQRTTGFRGLHGSVESAYAIMKSIEIFYNFINKHGALNGKSPSELAIPSLQFQTANRWLELINLANKDI
jgi:transposase-like protein